MKQISKTYEAVKYEDKIYKIWEKSGKFNPDNIKSSKKYCNILPPPNANGELHLGHASGYTVMDIFGRFERMNGKKVLLLPGKDHAGIQTQVVFEKKIKEENNLTRYDMGREKFYKACYDFCMGRSKYMRSQEKQIGISADWSREKFTLDPDGLKIALETFVKLYQDDLVYKGKRIINWCPRCATALSDVEVVHKKQEGKFYYIKYPIKDSKGSVTVATTRPETMLGDTAVAVNPKDERFKDLVGKFLILPLQNREIPIIYDRRIDMEFGTGAVKITPTHDPLDWKIGKDHKLKEIQVINEKAEITEAGGKYFGMTVSKAREKIISDLSKLGLLEKEEILENNISICERCKTTIEPLISNQWFIRVDDKNNSLKNKTLEAIKSGKVKIYPESFKKILIQWFNNMEDWCISRQIWWGPQFPVWYKGEEVYVGLEKPKGKGWVQDENTFDTWFSSGQWPYTTLGYPKGKDYKKFYQTDMMIMGRDILFFWAARMLMLGVYRTGKVPFKNLFFTGLIRDKDGYKFSKSRGNGIEPLEMIKKFGADAFRLSLVMDIAPGQDTRIFDEKIENFRNFVTKLWNIYRYSSQVGKDFRLLEKIGKKDLKTLSDRWIVSELQKTIEDVSRFMESKNISLAQERLRRFTWDALADWYIETNKIEKNAKVLGFVLDKILKLWHPFVPFVTEKIWQDIYVGKRMLMMEKWPKVDKKLIDKKAEKEFEHLKDIISKIRNIRSSYHIDPAKIVEACLKKSNNCEIIGKLARLDISSDKNIEKGIKIIEKNIIIILDIANLIDVEKEKSRFMKEITELENSIKRSEAILANKNFILNAPKEIVDSNKQKLAEFKEKIKVQSALLDELKRLK